MIRLVCTARHVIKPKLTNQSRGRHRPLHRNKTATSHLHVPDPSSFSITPTSPGFNGPVFQTHTHKPTSAGNEHHGVVSRLSAANCAKRHQGTHLQQRHCGSRSLPSAPPDPQPWGDGLGHHHSPARVIKHSRIEECTLKTLTHSPRDTIPPKVSSGPKGLEIIGQRQAMARSEAGTIGSLCVSGPVVCTVSTEGGDYQELPTTT